MHSSRIRTARSLTVSCSIPGGLPRCRPPQSMNTMTHRCKNIILPKTLFAGGNYRPQRSCGQGNIFTPVCQSFCSQGGGHAWWGGGACVARGHAWWRGACVARGACMAKGGMCGKGGMHGKGGACVMKGVCVAKGECVPCTPPSRDTTWYSRSMRGRYTSYWNAYLLWKILVIMNVMKS